jgi:hypothetical protein
MFRLRKRPFRRLASTSRVDRDTSERATPRRELFRRLDRNGDGAIERNEIPGADATGVDSATRQFLGRDLSIAIPIGTIETLRKPWGLRIGQTHMSENQRNNQQQLRRDCFHG